MSTNLFNPIDKRKYPSRWPLYRGKQLFRVIDERSDEGTEDLLSVSHITGITPRSQKNVTMFKSESLIGYKLCQMGDIVANTMWTWQGAIGVSKYEGVVSPAYNVYRQRKDYFNSTYLDMLLREHQLVDVYHSLSTGIRPSRLRLYPDVFLTIEFPVPPRAEQDQIVRFLDWKVSEINKLIGIRRKEIQELNQAKESIITRAVTHGIKKRVKYKTNDKYYKELPIGWHITKTRHVLLQPLTDGPHTTPTFFEDGIPFVSAEAVSCGNGRIDFEHIRGFISQDFYEECCKKYIPQIDDIYMIKSGATTGRVAIVDTDKIFTIWSPLAVFRCNPRVITARFLFYALQANPYQQQVQDGWSYGTQQNIGMRVLERLKIAYPDIVEQNEISSYLDSKCNLFERLIQLTRNKIKGLLELKNTIISDVVTGKIDVRNIPVPDYEHVGDSANDGEGNDEETGIPGEED